MPRHHITRADLLSHETEDRSGYYMLKPPELVARLDTAWQRGQHMVDRLAYSVSVQDLQPPYTCPYCSYYFELDAVLNNAVSTSWADDNNRCFTPRLLTLLSLSQLLSLRSNATSTGTRVVTNDPAGPVYSDLFPRGQHTKPPAPFVREVRHGGAGHSARTRLHDDTAPVEVACAHLPAMRVEGRRPAS